VLDLNNHKVKNTAALLGGWNEWTANHMPTETGPPKAAAAAAVKSPAKPAAKPAAKAAPKPPAKKN
jgi:3-mercaptopyruvate sulfurtransferase SseA